ncbi:hypothetical protein QYF50_18875 [Paenibacillus vini]|uniref:hypothetical protein n=1 Tax=Paenibacillus vini TaxID=1476024 RepID=UPI0025B6D83D|nr:hypothetical protein [Paenibacillus vini]MDN4069970.1 hypothetical protein [Paenibacillus vini]
MPLCEAEEDCRAINHGMPWTLEEKVYLAKFHGPDGLEMVSASLGRDKHAVNACMQRLKRQGIWDKYKNMPYEEYEQIVLKGERGKEHAM